MIVRSCSPMRLGLAGGGTDIDAFATAYGGFVLNVSISKYAITTIDDNTNKIIFCSDDMSITEDYSLDDDILYNGRLDLLKAAYLYFIKQYNDNIKKPLIVRTYCDAPAGSGLGASSTLMVSIIHALSQYFNVGMGEYELAYLAFKIERNELSLAGGKQDQFAATFGGFNFMEFYADDRVIVNPLRVKENMALELETSLLLFYTGISRESANIIDEQKENVQNSIEQTLQGLLELKKQAVIMKEALLTGDFYRIVDALNEGWKAKKATSAKVSNVFLDSIYQDAINAGALAGKVSGAGGGGFFMFIVPIERRTRVIQALKPYNGEFFNCTIDKRGSYAWTVNGR